jgi:hypothetical protein
MRKANQYATTVEMELFNLENNAKSALTLCKDAQALVPLIHNGLALQMLKINQYAIYVEMESLSLENNVKLVLFLYKDVQALVP